MWTRRKLIRTTVWISFSTFPLSPLALCWAKVKRLLPKGFSREELKNMNPEEIDGRNLEIDPLETFGTMGPTDVEVDIKTYRLKITGKVKKTLSLTYDEILKYPPLTETVLLICPGFFANNGRWTGAHLNALLQEAVVSKEARSIDIKGAYEKVVRIPLKELHQKKILFWPTGSTGKPFPKTWLPFKAGL